MFSDFVGNFFELGVGEIRANNPNQKSENIAKLIIHPGTNHIGG